MLKRSSIDKIMQCVVLSIFSKYSGPDDFSKTLNNHSTRFILASNLHLPPLRISRCFQSFLYQSITNWNKLPEDIKISPNLFKLKKKLIIYLANLS